MNRDRVVHQSDIEAAREYLAGVNNATQLMSALGQLRPEVVAVLAETTWGRALGLRFYGVR